MATIASNNPFPSILIDESAAPSSPPAGHQRLYIDQADNRLKRKNSSGAVVDLEPTVTFGIGIDGGGSVITTGVKGSIRIPFACTITKWTLLSDDATPTSGSIVVDIWKDSFANHPPTVADTITASAKPTITTATKAESSTLTGWTTAIAAGDILRFNVDSVTSLTKVVLELEASVP